MTSLVYSACRIPFDERAPFGPHVVTISTLSSNNVKVMRRFTSFQARRGSAIHPRERSLSVHTRP